MKRLKFILSFMFIICLSISMVACGSSKDKEIAESVELTTAKLSDVEFKNSKLAKLEQKENIVTVSGVLDAMSDVQKEVYGKEGITHVVVLEFEFDDDRTLSKFEIKGNETKVYADSSDVENYVGSLSDLLDNKDNEDAYANLILSANTTEYKLTATYTDGTASAIDLKITATLATAEAE